MNSKAMSAQPAAKRARPPALDATVSPVAAPGLGNPGRGPSCLFVLADGTLLACPGHSIRVRAPSVIEGKRQPGRDASTALKASR